LQKKGLNIALSGGRIKELTQIYQDKGLSEKTAKIVAEELSAKDPCCGTFRRRVKA